MTKPAKMTKAEKVSALREIILEIRRLNEAAGETVFNPEATRGAKKMFSELTGFELIF